MPRPAAAAEILEDRTLLSHCGPFDLGDGEGPKFIGDGLTTITEDFSDNPNHEDPETVAGGFDSCEAQGERLFTHTTVGISGIIPIVGADIPVDQVRPEMGHIFVLLGEDRIEFKGIHPDFHVAAVSVDVLASGFSTAQATVRVVGQNGTISLSPENDQQWEQVLATRGTILPGTTDELGPIQSVSLVGTTDFSIFDNVTILIDSNRNTVPNSPPNAFDDSVAVLPNYTGQPVETFAINVLANDDDPDLDPISVVSVTDPDHGTATIANDRVRYTPDIDFHGTDRFDYTIRDDHAQTSTATVNVTVNTPPTATGTDFFFDHGTTGAVEIAAPGLLAQGFDADGDPLTAELVTQPDHGTVVVNPDGSFTYTPMTPGDVLRSDVFSFALSDGFQQSNVAQVGINVPNQAPLVADLVLPGQGVNFRHGTEGPIFARLNASDADGDPLAFEIVTSPEHGAVTLLADGWLAYQPVGFSYVDWDTGEFHPTDGQFRGPDSFEVQAVDPLGARSAPATVRINVPNDAPQTTENLFSAKGTPEGPGTAEDVFAPVHLTGSNVVLLTDEEGNTLPYDHGVPGEFPAGGSPPEGRLELLFHDQLEELRYSFELANIENVKLVRLHLGEEGNRGPFVAVLYSAPAGNGPFPGTRQFGTVTEADLVGPFAGDFAAFAEALRAGNIYVSVFTDDGFPAPGIGEESGPGDFHLTGELRGQIRKAGGPTYFAAPGPLWNDSDPNLLGTDASGDPIFVFDPLRMAVVRGPQHGTLLFEPPAHPAAPVPAQPQFSDGSFTYYPEVGFEGIDEFVYVANDGHRSSLPTRVRIDVTMPSAELAARLHDDVVQLTTQDWVPSSSENRIAHFRKEFSVTGNDEIPASFMISGFHFREFSSTPLSLSTDVVEFGGGPQQSFVGDRYAAYGIRLDRSLSLSNSNVAAVKLVVTDLDQDGDGITDSEEGIFTRNPGAAFDPTILGTVGLDNDNDGWSNAFEANAPNGGDANFDGILDLRQPNVTSFLLVGAERVATLAAPAGTQILGILATDVFPPDAPDGVEFPVGIIDFAIDGVFPTVPVEVELILHDEPVFNTYYKFGRTPDNPTPHWYEFLYDGRTGAELIDADADGGIEKVVLHFLDGERGDNDLAFNGTIVDPGGPALENAPPVIPAIDAAATHEGSRFDLQVGFTDADSGDTHTATIDWGDGSAIEAGTVTQTATGGQVSATHTFQDNSTYTVTVTVTDDKGGVGVGTFTVDVSNLAPVITSLSNNAASVGDKAEGRQIAVAGNFTDAGVLDTHVATINWGDGTTSAGTVTETNGSGSVGGTHVYADGGIYMITLTLTDDDGGVDTATTTAYITGAGINNGVLQVVGTAGNDIITVMGLGRDRTGVFANFLPSPGLRRFSVADISSILIVAGPGDDIINLAGNVAFKAIVDGGSGRDFLNGGSGSNVLIGGEGDDRLIGGSGRDILIGGIGDDLLQGRPGADLLIGNRTAFDDDYSALDAILAEWTSDRSREQRIANLTGLGTGPRNNGNLFLLSDTTVFDDGVRDKVFASSDDDWLFSL